MKSPRLLATLVVASLTLGLAAVPAAQAAPAADVKAKQSQSRQKLSSDLRKVRKRTTTAERRIRSISRTIRALNGIVGSNRNGLEFLLGAAPQLVNGLTQLRDGSLQLKAGLEAAGAGLTKLQAALEDPVTGLVGLNNARPKFAVVLANGTVAGSTPGFVGVTHPAGSGAYVLDFGQDVSKRAPQLSLAPQAGSIPVGQIASCTAAAATCDAIAPGNTNANSVLVTTQEAGGSGATADRTFTATMIAG